MDLDGIREVIGEVLGPNIPTKVINGWVSLRCPLAPWTHASGKDSRESAGISIQPTGTSVFNCYTCKNTSPLQGMIKKYANYTGENFDELIGELEEEAYLGSRTLPEWERVKELDEDPVPLKESVYLDLYDSAAGHPYLRKRGISDETAELLQLMLDPEDPTDGEERILFPVFGPTGELYGLSGRATSDGARLKVRDYHGLKKAKCVLGSHLIHRLNPDKILVVEGLVDYASGWENGQPTVAVMHSNMTERQAAIIRELGKPTYLFYDNDDAGQSGVDIAGKLLRDYVPTMKVRYPDVQIEDDSEEGWHWLKDPGEMTRDEFESMVKNARLY